MSNYSSASDLSQSTLGLRKGKNHTGVTWKRGRPVQFARLTDDFTFKNAANGIADGVLREDLEGGDEGSSIVVCQGVVPVRFKNHASAEPGTYAAMINDSGQVYMTYANFITNAVVVTDQSDGTDIQEIEQENPPLVRFLDPWEFTARLAADLQDQIDNP